MAWTAFVTTKSSHSIKFASFSTNWSRSRQDATIKRPENHFRPEQTCHYFRITGLLKGCIVLLALFRIETFFHQLLWGWKYFLIKSGELQQKEKLIPDGRFIPKTGKHLICFLLILFLKNAHSTPTIVCKLKFKARNNPKWMRKINKFWHLPPVRSQSPCRNACTEWKTEKSVDPDTHTNIGKFKGIEKKRKENKTKTDYAFDNQKTVSGVCRQWWFMKSRLDTLVAGHLSVQEHWTRTKVLEAGECQQTTEFRWFYFW